MFLRMTVRPDGAGFAVFKLQRARASGYATDGAAQRFVWSVPRHARPRFRGTYADCLDHIAAAGAQFMSEHGIPV